jgi:hypothetical protein
MYRFTTTADKDWFGLSSASSVSLKKLYHFPNRTASRSGKSRKPTWKAVATDLLMLIEQLRKPVCEH